ncbi:aldehyde-activating protein [Tautonia sociabilis]|uniref:Aldehyde-activating protein n=1 Tax=Tautonia sociabilis TaxID=2080755 RepID=A0A432MI89_9BACT|nr:formaldehyde-activating enzyme [Tautonia sociabilis]RUL86915.1 aldehyde-activating protein [Tautonia sociabilis]
MSDRILSGDQAKGHTRVFALLNSDVQVRPATVMVSKVTVRDGSSTNILMGTVQAAVANGVLDAVRAGDIPWEKVNDLGIMDSVGLGPAVTTVDRLDPEALFRIHREATAKVMGKAMRLEPTIDWLRVDQEKGEHHDHRLGRDGQL